MIEATSKNTRIACLKHNAGEGKPCNPSSRTKHEPVFVGHVCGNRYRQTKN